MTAVDTGRDGVLHQLERAYERHAVQEQLLRTTDPEQSELHHQVAVRLLRARMVEDEDPRTPPMAVHCLNCAAAYAAGGR